jgi:small subunit ribosomal protein S6
MREYETVFLLKPDLPTEQISTLKDKFVKAITKGSGQLVTQGDWGKRKLAYDIKKLSHAHYIYLQYICGGKVVHNLERLLKLDDAVLKFLTVKLADEVDPEKRLAEGKPAPEAPDSALPERAPEPVRRGGFSSDRGRRHDRAPRPEKPREEAKAPAGSKDPGSGKSESPSSSESPKKEDE